MGMQVQQESWNTMESLKYFREVVGSTDKKKRKDTHKHTHTHTHTHIYIYIYIYIYI